MRRRRTVPESVADQEVSDSPTDLLSAKESAQELGVTVATLYGWLGLSRHNMLEIRGQRITVNYFQGGPKGQGRILIEAREVARLKEAMRVTSVAMPPRRTPIRYEAYPGIVVAIGRPDRV